MSGVIPLFFSSFLSVLTSPVPITKPIEIEGVINPTIPAKFCLLGPELGNGGEITFLEDCPSLDRFDKIPMPGSFAHKHGVHPIVCCPRYLPKTALCFPSDAWCPNHVPPDYNDFEDYDTTDHGSSHLVFYQPKMSDESCSPVENPTVQYIPDLGNDTATCVTIDRCPAVVDQPYAPQTHIVPCGFHETSNLLMVCCPTTKVEERQDRTQEPRFPDRRGKARKCEDKSPLCPKWKDNEGCRLDLDIVISDLDPYNGVVQSKNQFDFMQTTCLSTCGWCGDKGCVDEHPLCQAWARLGLCLVNPFFMAHTCRESCGVCGFLSPDNKEEQEVSGKSFTDITKGNFDCGRYKPLCEINGGSCEEIQQQLKVESTTTTTTESAPLDVDLRDADSDRDVFFSFEPNTEKGEFFCGATMVSDRWVVAASHCYDDFATGVVDGPKKINVNTIREGTPYREVVEIKRVYKHPLYKYPSLYNDVAVLELGRRVEYDYDKFGDTPQCIDQGLEKEGKLATVQGFGITETGTKGALLEANVTVISNTECKAILQSNITDDMDNQRKITKALPYGLDYGLLCAKGIMKLDNVYTGACKGDSGGPLSQEDEQGRRTLIGIVSGGISCGQSYPGWYTRVAFFKSWIQCIIDQSLRFNNVEEKVKEACKFVVEPEPVCEDVVDQGLFDLRNIGLDSEEVCRDYKYKTGAIVDVDNDIFEG